MSKYHDSVIIGLKAVFPDIAVIAVYREVAGRLGWLKLTRFSHFADTRLPGFRRAKQTGRKARARQSALPIEAIRGLVTTTLAFAIAVLLFLTFSIIGTAYSINGHPVHTDIGVGNTVDISSQHTITHYGTSSGITTACEYAKIPELNKVLSGHSGILFTNSKRIEAPPSIQRSVVSDTSGITKPVDSFIDYISSLVETKLSWYVLVVIPNILLLVIIVKRIVNDMWYAPRVPVYLD